MEEKMMTNTGGHHKMAVKTIRLNIKPAISLGRNMPFSVSLFYIYIYTEAHWCHIRNQKLLGS